MHAVSASEVTTLRRYTNLFIIIIIIIIIVSNGVGILHPRLASLYKKSTVVWRETGVPLGLLYYRVAKLNGATHFNSL